MNRVWFIVFGLTAVIILLLIFDKDPEPYDTTQWKEAIQRSNDKITVLQQDKLKLARKIALDSVRRDQERKAYQSEVKKRVSEIARIKQNPRVVYIRESEPTIDSLIVAYDSMVQLKDDRIDELEVSLDELQINMKAVNTNCDQMLEAERDKFKDSEEFISDLEKQVKRSKRGNRRLTAGIIVSAVAGLFLGSGL